MLPNKQPNTSIMGYLNGWNRLRYVSWEQIKCLVPEENEQKVGVRQFLLDQLDGAG